VSNNTELTALHKAAANAFRLYAKTRPAPSLESSKRSKGLPREGLHPSLREKVRNVEAELAAFTERLKAIRPKQTVIESEAEAAKGKHKKVCFLWHSY
jgi:ATP-dependent RNA helicase DDX54/DBP10